MTYPYPFEIEVANRSQLYFWYKTLDKPGESTLYWDNPKLTEKIIKEETILFERITERLRALGGFYEKGQE